MRGTPWLALIVSLLTCVAVADAQPPALHHAVGRVAHLYWVRQGSPTGAAGEAVAAKNWSDAARFVQVHVVRPGGGSESFLNVVGKLASEEIATRQRGPMSGPNFERHLALQIGLATRAAANIPGAN